MPSARQVTALASRQPATQYHSRLGRTGALACADRMTSPSPFREGAAWQGGQLSVRVDAAHRASGAPAPLTGRRALSVPHRIVVLAHKFEEAGMCWECDHPGRTRL